MKSKSKVLILAGLLLATGCAHTRYRIYVHNGTSAKITETKVALSNGESLSFGTMDPAVDAGMWPVIGPLGKDALVEWMDSNNKKKSATTSVTCGSLDDSVIFLINSDDTVTVQTGHKLYGPRKSN
jgi:hypothetical protein